jgi:hypothetical protein
MEDRSERGVQGDQGRGKRQELGLGRKRARYRLTIVVRFTDCPGQQRGSWSYTGRRTYDAPLALLRYNASFGCPTAAGVYAEASVGVAKSHGNLESIDQSFPNSEVGLSRRLVWISTRR